MDPLLSREQFFAAVESGDARVVAAFFKQRTRVGVSNSGDDDQYEERRAGHEWLRPFDEGVQYAESNSLVAIAIARDYADVLEWLFSTEAITSIESESLCAALHSACQVAMRTKTLALLELLLASPVFTQLLPGEKQQLLLDKLLCAIAEFPSAETIRLLTAHGAYVNTRLHNKRESYTLWRTVRTGNNALIDAVLREGAFTVGVGFLSKSLVRRPRVLKRLLQEGCQLQNQALQFHHVVAVGLVETAKFLLMRGTVDVDVRNSYGETPLMRVALLRNERWVSDLDPCAAMTALLLEYGADVAAKDMYEKTPLRHAIDRDSAETVRLLLKNGADPNQPTEGQRAALEFLNFDMLDKNSVVSQLEYLLEYGANPFAPGHEGLSAVDQLQQSEKGRAFVQRHPEWFACWTQDKPQSMHCVGMANK